MENKKNVVEKGKDRKTTYTCVCSMEWRGMHDNEWGDCICYPDSEVRPEK